ncbi:dioxygenase [Aureimonas sp. SA4125]|uniref:ring-cleaving dioxygenase n=1 Tax=Aureimonas sp. SA4125 TaxID=2826993 RepID=UPI001CC47461|nr:ring-cleaving dioxygenase [Aureimonas sp. SA4125]BDA86781.1 dioxygenase [Aureimonas sp. SA4125]
MLDQIKGLHHVTSMAANARDNNAFFTETLGLRRVKKTVNFDSPDVYHLYYGDEVGTPGSVMTYFPFPHIAKGKPGAGEVGATAFSVPKDSLGAWETRLGDAGVAGLSRDSVFGAGRLHFEGPDGDGFALIETEDDARTPFLGGGVDADAAIRGFHSVQLRLRDGGATSELLTFMGYEEVERSGAVTRLRVKGGGVADVIDIETLPGAPAARQGAGSVHHVAFAVENRQTQLEVRKALMDTGYQVTPVIDRDYFWAIYFRTPGGVLFEVATNEPGFERDEPRQNLGQGLMLPARYEPSRVAIIAHLPPL